MFEPIQNLTIRENIFCGNFRFDRSHFQGYADSALTFETVYYVLIPDYAVYMDVQQEINLKILEAFRERSIEFAYPTRTVYLEPAEADAGPTQIGFTSLPRRGDNEEDPSE